MPAFICSTCGTQYPPSEAPPAQCPVCEDERQYIPPEGQSWTTLERLEDFAPQRISPVRAGPHRHRHARQNSPSGNARCWCVRLKATFSGIASR